MQKNKIEHSGEMPIHCDSTAVCRRRDDRRCRPETRGKIVSAKVTYTTMERILYGNRINNCLNSSVSRSFAQLALQQRLGLLSKRRSWTSSDNHHSSSSNGTSVTTFADFGMRGGEYRRAVPNFSSSLGFYVFDDRPPARVTAKYDLRAGGAPWDWGSSELCVPDL